MRVADNEFVRVMGPEPSGLAQMLGAIAQMNLERRPDRARYLEGSAGVVRIVATDAGVAVALEFRDGTLRIYSGDVTAPADVEISADSESLTGMSSVPQLGPLPHPFKRAGRAALAKALRGDVKVRGAVRNGKLLKRMRGLLAVDPE